MGYDAAAARTVDASDATVGDEAVGPWVRRDDAALRALATRDDARERTRYLWFLRLVERRDGGAAASWAASSLHASSSRLPVAAFVSEAYDVEPLDLARRIAAREPSLRLAALEAESGAAGTTVPERSEVFARLSALTSRLRARGPFFDRGLRVARASASVLSAIAAEQRILLDVLGAPSAASEALEAFGPSSDHGDFLAWSSNLVAASDGQRDVSALLRDLSARSTVGAPLPRADLRRPRSRPSTTVTRDAAAPTSDSPRGSTGVPPTGRGRWNPWARCSMTCPVRRPRARRSSGSRRAWRPR